jgi:hypothetical protein
VREVKGVTAAIEQHAVHLVDHDAIELAIPADIATVEGVQQVVALEIGQFSVDDGRAQKMATPATINDFPSPVDTWTRIFPIRNFLSKYMIATRCVSRSLNSILEVQFKFHLCPIFSFTTLS